MLKSIFTFLYLSFLSRTLTIHTTTGEKREPSLFHPATSTHLQTFRYLFAFCITDDCFAFIIVLHIITRLLFDEIDLPLRISASSTNQVSLPLRELWNFFHKMANVINRRHVMKPWIWKMHHITFSSVKIK